MNKTNKVHPLLEQDYLYIVLPLLELLEQVYLYIVQPLLEQDYL